MLVILDGWGLAPASATNAVSVAATPNFDLLWSNYPHTKLIASGEGVGLPVGQMGNSEVGHLNIGAGRVVLQDLPRITKSIKDGSFFKNQVLAETFEYAKKNNKPVHMMGLLSDGGVHSHISHLFAILEYAKKMGVHDVYVHAFLDGRDVEPESALKYLSLLEKEMEDIGVGKLATISGRYYAMDRDNRWDRVKLAYEAMVEGKGELADTASEAVQDSYARGVSDEFVRPTIIDPKGRINESDAVIFFNLRSDRPRQLSRALVDPCFSGFKCSNVLSKLHFVTMTEYDPTLKIAGVVFPQERIKNVLSEVFAEHDLSQFHIAETEKYAHVTFFLDGGVEKASSGEERLMIPSPQVTTYDKQPEMSAAKVAEKLIENIGKFDFIAVNFANADMVGHTGNMKATVKACEAVDTQLGLVVKRAQEADYEVVIVADHGNAEKMLNSDGSPCTSHTTNPVPFILVSKDGYHMTTISQPKLGNIAPTILALAGLPSPAEMMEEPLCSM
jgi:2,3-bisphosphoglycerate-independent phosphoglycerate mutase